MHHRVQTEGTSYRNVVLRPDHVPSKHKLLMPYTVAVVTILWPFVQTFSKHMSLELKKKKIRYVLKQTPI
jgi:hypothetical protein